MNLCVAPADATYRACIDTSVKHAKMRGDSSNQCHVDAEKKEYCCSSAQSKTRPEANAMDRRLTFAVSDCSGGLREVKQ